MKIKSLFYIGIVVLLCSCRGGKKTNNNQQGTVSTQQKNVLTQQKKTTSDYQIIEKGTDYNRLIYTVSIKGKPSILYFELYEYTDYYPEVILSINMNAELLEEEKPKQNIILPTYQDIIRSMELVIARASAKHNMKKLRHINLDLENLGEQSLKITNSYRKQYGTSKIINYANLSKCIEHSKLATDVNRIVAKYGLMIKEASVEKVFYTNVTNTYSFNTSIIPPSKLASTQVLNAITYLTLSEKAKR